MMHQGRTKHVNTIRNITKRQYYLFETIAIVCLCALCVINQMQIACFMFQNILGTRAHVKNFM